MRYRLPIAIAAVALLGACARPDADAAGASAAPSVGPVGEDLANAMDVRAYVTDEYLKPRARGASLCLETTDGPRVTRELSAPVPDGSSFRLTVTRLAGEDAPLWVATRRAWPSGLIENVTWSRPKDSVAVQRVRGAPGDPKRMPVGGRRSSPTEVRAATPELHEISLGLALRAFAIECASGNSQREARSGAD